MLHKPAIPCETSVEFGECKSSRNIPIHSASFKYL